MVDFETRTDHDLSPFVLDGSPIESDNEVIADDDTRVGDIATYTLLTQDPATQAVIPLTNAAATDGTEIPYGIMVHSYTQAEVRAGPITNVNVYIGGTPVFIDREKLVIENSLTPATELTNQNKTIERALRDIGIYLQSTEAGDRPENS